MKNDNDFFARILKATPEELAGLKEKIACYYSQPKIVKGSGTKVSSPSKEKENSKKNLPDHMRVDIYESPMDGIDDPLDGAL